MITIKSTFAALSALVLAAVSPASPLTAPAAVHTQPDANSPVVAVLAPGTEPTAAANAVATTPAGWMAVQQPGPFEAYVLNTDMDKALNVKPGTKIHLQPSAESGVLAVMGKGDKTMITGLHGKWSQIRLDQPITGYIRLGAPEAAPLASAAMNTAPTAGTMPVPTAPIPYVDRNPVPAGASLGDSASALPRQFQGKFVSTRRPFMPRRPYDWQLNDDAGVRYAYLDISRLLLTDQIENYAGHDVVVYGTPTALPDGLNIVIHVETLRLK
ncbi:MAG: hypothetical protein ACHRHE_13175 [Tepidisphaerales bacterium]